jgi:two-component sensor histidine kinase
MPGKLPESRRPSGAFIVDDPTHVPFGVEWMRGITPLRLGILAAVCLMFAARPTLWNISPDNLFRSLRALLTVWGEYFLCALPLFMLVVQVEARTAKASLRSRIAALAIAVAVGALAFPVGNAAFRTLKGNFIPGQQQAWQSWHYMLAFYIRGLSTGGLLSAILLFAAQQRDAERRISQARLARVAIERQMAESRLQLLQAQIEPHFLFNSLASVKRLHEKEPGGGRALLRNLGDYLRAAGSAGERREVRLGDEIVLARSFLSIFQVRMGERLRVRIEVPANLESALIPPLMVGTLTENAIKHGIGPRATGGTVVFAARSAEGILEVEVADDGVGFRARTGYGVGLANTRARLETLYGREGSLELVANGGGGVTATIRIPHRSAMPAASAP